MSPTPDLRPQRARICAANATIVLLEDGDLEAQKAWQTRFELDAHGVTRVAIPQLHRGGANQRRLRRRRPPSRQPCALLTDTSSSYARIARNRAGNFAMATSPAVAIGDHSRPAKRSMADASSADDAPQRPSKFGRLQIAEAAPSASAAHDDSSATGVPLLLHLPRDLLAVPAPPSSRATGCCRSRCAAARCATPPARAARGRRRCRRLPIVSVVDALFGGAVPPPPPEIGSWRAWYFAFDRDWLDHARARHPDKLLLRMTSQCAESSPNCHGVPPTPMGVVRVSFDLRVPLTAWRLPVNLEVPGWWSQPPTYAIFDATDFVNYHPGSADLLHAGRVDDATEFFDLVSHSERARQVLRALVVAGLEALPPPRAPPKPKKQRPMLNALALARVAVAPRRGRGRARRSIILRVVCYELMGAGALLTGPRSVAPLPAAAFASSWLYGVFVVSSLRRRRCFALVLCAVSAASLT